MPSIGLSSIARELPIPIVTIGHDSFEYESITPALDAAFASLYASLASGQAPNAQAFDPVAVAYLATTASPDDQDRYFNNFTAYWMRRLQQGHFRAASHIWPWALRPVLAYESASGKLIHKGSPYFFWAMSSLLNSDLDVGYLLLNRAFEEDIRTHGSVSPNTPGLAVATLDDTVLDNILRPYVQMQAAALERRLSTFRAKYRRALTLQQFRAKFLALPQLRQTVSMFSYALARAERFVTFDPQLWIGTFPSQIAFDTVFDLCLVVDDALHQKNPSKWKFFDHALFLSKAGALGLQRSELTAINQAFAGGFTPTLSALLSGTFAIGEGAPLNGVARSVAITYGCRNRGAHTISSTGLTATDYTATVDHILYTLCFTVDVLY